MIFPTMLLKHWLRFFALSFAAADVPLGGGGEAAPPPVTEAPAVAEVPDTPADGEEHLSDLDVLNEEEPPVVQETPEQKAEREKAAQPQETAEQKAAREKAAKPAEQKAAQTDDEKEAAAAAELENRPVKAIREYLDKKPALKAAVEADKGFMNRIFTDARRSARLAQYQPHFATPELAAQAAQDLTVFDGFEQPWYSEAPEAPKELLGKLLDADIVRDKAGNPVMQPGVIDKDGNPVPKTHGRYTRLVSTYRELGLYPSLLENAEAIASWPTEKQLEMYGQEIDFDEFKNFIEIAQRIMGDADFAPQRRKPGSAQKGENDESNLSDEQKRLLAIGRGADSQQQTEAQKTEETFRTETGKAIVDGSKAVLQERVKVAAKAFNEGTQGKILDDAYKRISAMAKADTPYKRHMRALQAACDRGEFPREALRAKLVNAAKIYVRERMSEVVRDVVAEYGKGAIQESADKHNLRNQQVNGSKEPLTQGANVRPTARNEIQMVQEATTLYAKVYGRQPRENDILDFDEDYIVNLKRMLKEKTGG
jgi:hypothetical protein